VPEVAASADSSFDRPDTDYTVKPDFMPYQARHLLRMHVSIGPANTKLILLNNELTGGWRGEGFLVCVHHRAPVSARLPI